MEKLMIWLRQPTSVAGLAAAFGALTALLTGELTWQQAVPVLAGALASIALPDDAAARGEAANIAAAAIAEASHSPAVPTNVMGKCGGHT